MTVHALSVEPQCENYGGGARCPRQATHRVRLDLEDGEYESEVCAECFDGFRAEMIKRGMPPRNEATDG